MSLIARKVLLFGHLPILLLIVANLLIGLWILPDYGESWDEGMLFQYADRSLRAYGSLRDPSLMPASFIEGDPLHGDHGPAFVIVVTLIRRAIDSTGLNIPAVDINHFCYFLVFQIGIIALYSVALRWISRLAAFGTALLFSTQPLLWGHAFINPKDSVFMSLFLASLATGLWMVERVRTRTELPELSDLRKELTGKLNTQNSFPVILWLAFFLVIWAIGTFLLPVLISKAYADAPDTLLGSIFQRFASHKGVVSSEQYIRKGQTLLGWVQDLLILFGFVSALRLLIRLAPNWSRSFIRWLAAGFYHIIQILFSPALWLAAFVLGFSTAVRVVAPLAGLLVSLYVIKNRKWKAILPLILYAGLSILIMLALWPHLWPAPVERFSSSIMSSTKYLVDVQTLFAGNLYYSTQIPSSYLPILFSLQFTETTLALILTGVVIFVTKRKPADFILIVSVWFLLPFTFFVFAHVPLYDNFRHILFIIPPLFLLAGTGLDWLFTKFRKQRYEFIIIGLAVLPALIANVNLHPYQYIYYNQLTGGVRGAFRNYQLDYWDVSYREAAQYLNQAALLNARIVPLGPYTMLKQYARKDLQFIDPETVASYQDYDFIVVSTRNNQDLDFSKMQTVYSIEREGVPLTVIKKP